MNIARLWMLRLSLDSYCREGSLPLVIRVGHKAGLVAANTKATTSVNQRWQDELTANFIQL